MEFSIMNKLLQQHFDNMVAEGGNLFTTNVDMDELWDLYQYSFEPEYNKIFRTRREHSCSCCKQFMRKMANVVAIKDNQLISIWDVEINDPEFTPPFKALSEYVKSKDIISPFLINQKFVTNAGNSDLKRVGTPFNRELLEGGQVHTWSHYFLDIPKRFVYTGHDTIGTELSVLTANAQVFKRSLTELTIDSVETVLELIQSNTLYRGQEWKQPLTIFLKLQKQFGKLKPAEKINFAWEQSMKVGGAIAKIRNHSIGTLLIDISGRTKEDGEVVAPLDLTEAVRRYETNIVCPEQYKRSSSIFTKKMLQQAQETIEKLGYMESLPRKFARINDIRVSNVLFSNKSVAKEMIGGNIFDDMLNDMGTDAKKFNKSQEISAEDFIANVLPTASEVEVLLENKHRNNLMSLIAPKNKDAKSMFYWDNNFSWAYSGNLADSTLKQQVIAKGGRVDGVLRMSSSWNHEGKRNQSLMDFHVFFPNSSQSIKMVGNKEIHDNYGNKNRVGWNNRTNSETGGRQDVDYVKQAPIDYVPVENITFPSLDTLPEGVYTFKAHNWDYRHTGHGFKSEIAFGDQVLEFDYDKEMKNKEWVTLAKIELKNGQWTVLESMKSTTTPQNLWGVKTQQFVPVSSIMFSPNHWEEGNGKGHKHLFMMLKGCVNDENPNGYFNEYLQQELFQKHRKVMEALGSKMRVEDDDKQLSGIGFSMTKRAEVVVKVIGKTQRIFNVKF